MLLALVVALLVVLLPVGPAHSAEPQADAGALTKVWRILFARPQGIPTEPDNLITQEKIALGASLFRDKRLSGAGDRACLDCHQPAAGFTDGLKCGRAVDGGALARNTPTLWNVAWGKSYMWDGRAPTLEAQAHMPIEHPRELAGEWDTILARLQQDASMVGAFAKAFPEAPAISTENVVRALASYERTLISPPTPFDRWIAGEEDALSAQELAGFRLFVGEAGCVGCHVGWRFTDERYHDIGLASDDPGRGAVPGGVPGLKAFKTPTLRELLYTAPYMHDGSKATLDDVLHHYTGGLDSRPTVSSSLVHPLRLNEEEKASLMAFLRSLSSDQPPAADR